MNQYKSTIIFVLTISACVFLLIVMIGGVWISYEKDHLCQQAKWQYGGDCVESLTMQLEDIHQGFRHRNHAIWALGQLGDSRALPILHKYYTDHIPGSEPLDEVISQYELKKAINLLTERAGVVTSMRKFIFP